MDADIPNDPGSARPRPRRSGNGTGSAVFLLAMTIACTAGATENGGNNYPIGVNTVTPAILPVPGQTVWQNYNVFYTAHALDNASGVSSVKGYNINVAASAERFLHTWNLDLGNFGLTSGVVQPIVYTDVHIGTRSDDRVQFGDMTLQPLYLSYHSPDRSFLMYAGVDIFIPSGNYSTHRLANAGRNVFGFLPNIPMTWFVTKHLELSAVPSVEIHTVNIDTHYHSGSFFEMDYGANYRFKPQGFVPVFVGIGGYALQQFSDDTLNGAVYKDGYRGRTIAVGPQVGALVRGVGLAVKYEHEFAVENRPRGDRFWFQFKLPL